MDTTTIILSLFAVVQAGLAWWMKETWSNIKDLADEVKQNRNSCELRDQQATKDLNDFRVSVAKEYASKDDIREIKEILQQLSRDLHAKADK